MALVTAAEDDARVKTVLVIGSVVNAVISRLT